MKLLKIIGAILSIGALGFGGYIVYVLHITKKTIDKLKDDK